VEGRQGISRLQDRDLRESHPFYTGKQKIVDTAGRVDKFKKRYARKGAAKAAE
jgi:hypothetical protein